MAFVAHVLSPPTEDPPKGAILSRIGFFEGYSIDGLYGNQRYTVGVISGLCREGVEATLFCPAHSDLSRAVEQRGCPVVVVPAPEKLLQFGGDVLRGGALQSARTVSALARYGLSLWRAFRSARLDALQCHNLRSLIMAGPAAKGARLPLVWYVKGHLDNPRLDRLAFGLADEILFQSATNRDRTPSRLLSRFGAKIQLLPNGIDVSRLDAAQSKDRAVTRADIGVADDHVLVAYLGILSPLKGLDTLLDAVALAAERVPNLEVAIVGSASVAQFEEYARRMQERADAISAASFHFLGFRQDALDILAAADIFVLPSLSEGTPRSILEAMGLGVPVVATDVGGVRELVLDGETGFVVPPNEPAPMAARIEALARNDGERQRLGARGRALIRSEYSLDRNVASLREIYERMGVIG